MNKTKLGRQVFKKGDRIRLKPSLNPNNITGTVAEDGAKIIKIALDNGIIFKVFWDEIERIEEE